MYSLPVESCTTSECGQGGFVAVTEPSTGATHGFSQNMFQGPCVTETACWQSAMPMQVVQQGVRPMLLVPVLVSPAWVNPQEGHGATGNIMYPNMGSMQQPQLYQVVQCTTMPGHCQSSPMNCTITSGDMFEPVGCQQVQVATTAPEHVAATQSIEIAASSPDSMKSHHEDMEPLCMKSVMNGKHSNLLEEENEEEEEDYVDELSVMTFDDKYDSRSFASSDASTATSRSARRRRGRRAAKARAAQEALSQIPISTSPSLDEVLVTTEMKKSLTQKLEAGGHEKQMAFMEIHGSVLKMALEPFGCRVLQLAFDVADPVEKQALVAELRGHVREAISSPHANFVIQKVIEVLPVSSADFVAQELLTFAVDAARHRFACRILGRLIEHHSGDRTGSATTNRLIDEILPEAEKLIHHNFARHVMELILEHGSPRQQAKIIEAIRKDLFRNAKCRCASYVAEQALYHCNIPERDALASDLINDSELFWALANHECGSHVIKALVKSHRIFSLCAKELLHAGAAKQCTSKFGQRLLEETK